MPELPEVETITKALKKVIVGKKITDIFLSGKKLRYPIPKNFKMDIIGQKFGMPFRKAKYCIIPISNNEKIILHLGMSGQKIDEIEYLNKIGPEPNSKKFNKDYLLKKIRNRNIPIKNILMNQEVVAGLGNIYVNEVLYSSKVSPIKLGSKLTSKNAELIVLSIKKIIYKSILVGGTTLQDHIQPDGQLGYFKNKLKVYGKINTLCNNCNTKIKHIKLSGRATFFCGFCQK